MVTILNKVEQTMMNTTQTLDSLTAQLSAQLGYERPPFTVSPREAAEILGATHGTMEVWRCTGRHNIPFVKVGSKVRYPLAGLAEFLARNTTTSTVKAGA
jgi:excisionase family DNA binding protein